MGDWGREGLTGCGGEDYETGPVVFDQFAHCHEVMGALLS